MVRLLSRWLPLLALLLMSACTSLPDGARGRF
ncbi:MAG: phospholipase, partial [Pseudomonadota bacterium]